MPKKVSLLAEIQRAQKQAAARAEREQREFARAHAAAQKDLQRARKAEERANAQAAKAAEAERKRLEKEAKEAHFAAMQAEVEEKNADIAEQYAEIDGLLRATLDVDDFVDLESLRRTAQHPPFERPDLETPTPPPAAIPDPPQPVFANPEPAKGLIGKKRKLLEAQEAAKRQFEQEAAAWKQQVARNEDLRASAAQKYGHDEDLRMQRLTQARAEYVAESRQREEEAASSNADLDRLIAELGYGTSDAIHEYVSIVVANSSYPDHFQVAHDFEFDPSTAELKMSVSVPAPGAVPSVKTYKYTKSTDQITSTDQSQKAIKDRYAGAVHQVALRTLHEVFESDRRALIKTIALEVGTSEIHPATGLETYVPFVAVGAEREAFLKIELASVVPDATLEYLGASVSKNPLGLVAADLAGVRTS